MPKSTHMLNARHEILDAANRRRDVSLPRLTMRNLQRAVFICRQRRLVKPKVIAAAGFRVG